MPGDADYGFDERLPFGFGQILADGEDFDRAMLLPRTALVARRGDVGGRAPSGDRFDGIG
jgi:hypothetical protein